MKIFNTRKNKLLRLKLRNNSTIPEKVLWKFIKNKQLGYKFRRQHGIGKYIVDFYCSELKLIIEIDGSVHNESEVFERDLIKNNYFKEQNLLIIRYSALRIKNDLDLVLSDLKNICDEIYKKYGNPT